MAVLFNLAVAPATQDQHNDFDARIGQYLIQAGGPPSALMSHVVYPEGDGFVLADVWRTEAEGQSFFSEVVQPMLSEVGLNFSGTTVRPVWSFARP